MFIILFVIFFALGLLFAFILNPVNVFSNVVQFVMGIAAIIAGIVAYFQGFFETAATGYFLIAGVGWVVTVMMRSRPVAVDY